MPATRVAGSVRKPPVFLFPAVIWHVILPVLVAAQARRPAVLTQQKADSKLLPRGGEWVVTIEVGSPPQSVRLIVSNTLTYSWVVGSAVCSGSEGGSAGILENCTRSHLGLFDNLSSTTWVGGEGQEEAVLIQRDLLGGVYRDVGLNAERDLMVAQLSGSANKRLLGIEGSGQVGTDVIQLNFPDQASYETLNAAMGVFTSGPEEESVGSGYLSAQQLAFGLYQQDRIPSPTYHLIQGPMLTGTGTDAEDFYHIIIFGGYDSQYLDLNTAKQYLLVEIPVQIDTPPSSSPPLSEPVAHRMEVYLDQLKWDTLNSGNISILEQNPSGYRCILDSTTPYIWLPLPLAENLAEVVGATYDAQASTYVFPADNQWNADGKLRFFFTDWIAEPLELRKSSLRHYDFPNSTTDFSGQLQIKALPDAELGDGEMQPIIFGMPFLREIQLFVNLADGWWTMNQGGETALNRLWLTDKTVTPLEPKVLPWDVGDPPTITNSLVVAEQPSRNGKGGGDGDAVNGEAAKRNGTMSPGVIAGIVIGICALLLFVGLLYVRRRRKARKRSSSQTRPPFADGKIATSAANTVSRGTDSDPQELHGAVSKIAWVLFRARKRQSEAAYELHSSAPKRPSMIHELDAGWSVGKGGAKVEGNSESVAAGGVVDVEVNSESIAADGVHVEGPENIE